MVKKKGYTKVGIKHLLHYRHNADTTDQQCVSLFQNIPPFSTSIQIVKVTTE